VTGGTLYRSEEIFARCNWLQHNGAAAHTANATTALLQEFAGDGIVERGILRGSIVSFVSKNRRARPSFSGKGETGSSCMTTRDLTLLYQYSIFFFGKTRDSRVESSPYSPDLSPPNFFLFPKIKSTLKGRRLEETEDIK
jgi:hypothetical protein